jgi:hypothetical protein
MDGSPDAWQCVCGNTPVAQGFFPCDKIGNLVEPTPEEWPAPLYVCDACGRIINQDTLLVLGRRPPEPALQTS